MPSLAEGQSRFIACLQKGPAHFPDDLFTEEPSRALLGLKAHANTVSHARLVALENAYPKLHEHMGHEPFHAISRDYIEQDHILTCDMNSIAADFADFLSKRGFSETEVDLARIEWAWIKSYHSAEAEPLALQDIATLDEAGLLGLEIEVHPAMRLIRLTGALSSQLAELGENTPDALMVARPEAEVLFHPLSGLEHDIAEKIANISTMGNLLATAIELGGEDAAMQRIIKLIQAGVITRI
ncbi:HvfC/BufC family peptide modification chaperone [Parasphingorhabdus cellanae]|uniref:DNA-binding domain-containing protein n=1 Tax=Parasphingorhabdus cellanae TaxID=2806553 RepID=A0ABX7T040_9SPHN|nr:putative DNA-binding domain-containing protein [Parasphingorhabdus cellanae]QTD54909.1 putative DNA-binding domain-containing protein [Parasphingorhabdus cellanae]